MPSQSFVRAPPLVGLALALSVACTSDNSLAGLGKPGSDGPEKDDTHNVETGQPGETTPVVEECNGTDDDGDGQIDEGFADTDGNGRADCLDASCPALHLDVAGPIAAAAECGSVLPPPPEDVWDVVVEWTYPSGVGGSMSMPVVGNMTDDNGDGLADEHDVPDVAFVLDEEQRLVLLSGDGGGVIFEKEGFYSHAGLAMADVTGDGRAEIVAASSKLEAVAIDATGAEVWHSTEVGMGFDPQPAVADVDGDGLPEVIFDMVVLNGEDGSLSDYLLAGVSDLRTPVLADLDQDGLQEIIVGDVVFDSTGVPMWTGGTAAPVVFSAVLDVDGDPGGEVVFVSRGVAKVFDSDGAALYSFGLPRGHPGPPCVADFDGDGGSELAVEVHETLGVYELDGAAVWTAAAGDNSGVAGCSAYDFDGDGAYELLFAGEEEMRIYDGATGTVRFDYPQHASGTLFEYPVVADIDGDGSAEVAFTSSWHTDTALTVLGHRTNGWPAAGPTWGVHDFNGSNLRPDGRIDSRPAPSWQGNNLFRARTSVDDRSAAELAVSITDLCVADCTRGPVAVAVGVENHGLLDAAAGVQLVLYAVEDSGVRPIAQRVLDAIPAGSRLDGVQFDVPIADLGSLGFMVTLDDRDQVFECEESDNRAASIDPCP